VRKIIIHPYLFALFPVLFLYAHNIDTIHINEIFTPVLLSILLAAFLVVISYLFTKDYKKSALISSLSIVLFFSYGHIYQLIQGGKLSNFIIGRHRYLLPLWALILIFSIYLIVRTKRQLKTITIFSNITSIILISISLINIGYYEFKSNSNKYDISKNSPTQINIEISYKPDTLPDIYYIILDGYARRDILKDIYDYDNSDFINWLTEKGFYVAERSNSNYNQTLLSLASSLNINFIQDIITTIPSSDDRSILIELIANNKLFEFLRKHNYRIIAFSSGYSGTEIESADIYKHCWALSEFHTMLINTTPLSAIKTTLFPTLYDIHRQRILYTFNELTKINTQKSPVFVFAHMLIPHPPFVFNKNGDKVDAKIPYTISDGSHLLKFINKEQYIEGYRNQIIFMNKNLEYTVEKILSKNHNTIIILQADHGPGSHLDWENPKNTYMNERMTILNAYYLPNGGDKLLYDSISPVNTFRVILNYYFGANLELLEDRSYFSCWNTPYNFIDVTDEVKSK